ncbi:hypothetical protein RhiirA1_463389 [Rhizophagus irregularis]|uniref:Uncharacterized protein n=3 Tax=Rhizophagus irregularis TaxID=588596 RepID=A0A2N0RK85_9GLOM|nr:hypothetical protein RhiirA1_463389 [Rhizophagus irregularis]
MVVMGFDDEIIINELLSDILFIPIFIRIDRILIVVSQIGISSHKGCYGAGPGFLSTLITKYKGKQSLFVQSIEDNCNLDVYDGDINQYHNEGITPDEIWKSINILNKFDGTALFGITNSYVQQELDKLRNNSITCTSNDWNDIDKLNLIFRQQIKTRKIASPFSDWSKLFKNWYEQNNTIIQFPNILFQIYPANYQFQEKELGAWRAMFRASGYINITPFTKKQHMIEFWTKAPDPLSDRDNLANLYKSGMLLLVEKKSSFQPDSEGEILWKSLQEALKANKRGIDGKIRILSIIAENFTYKKLKEKLKVGNDIVNFARKHARLYGPGVPTLVKTKRTVKLTQSSYRVDKNGLPILYMRDQKIKLWKKFEETFPNGMKKTSFMGRLANCSNIKYRDDIGGLCLTCNDYGYIPFELYFVLQKIDALKRHLRCGYERELVVNADGTTKHDSCISHCLPYAFGNCLENHNSRCSECDQFFEFFEFMHLHIKEDQIATLEETKEHLQYYLAHSTRKIYLNSQFKATLASLDEDGALFVADYKMRILPRSARETKAEFFVRDWQFLEPGEAKTTIDSHHAAIAHSIRRYVRIGYDVREGKDIVEAAKHLSGTSLANLEPDRDQLGSNVKMIKGISNLFYWKWPVSGEMIGYICARSLPHFGPWNNFPPSTIAKLCTKLISLWLMHSIDTDTVDPIVPEFMDNNNENDELEDANSIDVKFQFPMGWALKSNQKFGGKGKGKRMKKKVKELLKSFFLNGNLNQKDKMLAKDMYNELMKFVESGELEAEDVPKITTIQNWISTYARTFKEQATENMVKDIRDESSL